MKDGAETTVAAGPAQDAVLLLQGEHRTVAALFDRLPAHPEVLAEISRELDRHARLEEEIFYPAVSGASVERHVAFEESVVFAEAVRALGKDRLVELAETLEQRRREMEVKNRGVKR